MVYKGEIRMSRPITIFDKMFSDLRHMQKNNNFSNPFNNLGFPKLKLKPLQRKTDNIDMDIPTQIKKFVKGITSTFTRITKGEPEDDYDEIIKGFLPPNAKLLTPMNPKNAGAIRLADLDGDLEKELIASYALNNTTTTFVLKKQNDRWQKLTEIQEPKHEHINYMGFADITGEGRKQIIVGRKGMDSPDVLHGYNLHNGQVNKIFSHNYSRVGVFEPISTNNIPTKKHIAIWSKNNANAFDVNVMHWNGTALEAVKDNTSYYRNKVLPFYGQRVKQMPKNPTHWYHLADSLMKSGMYRDGLTAIDIGLRLKPVSPSKDEFLVLKSQLQEKMKK